jgi:hypothetical protein
MKLMINGVEVDTDTHPELAQWQRNVVAEAHKTEKDKLYTTIDELKKEVKLLKDAPVVTTPTPTSTTNNNQQPAIDVKQLVSDVTESVVARINPAIKQLHELVEPLKNDSEFMKQASIADYRNKLIFDNQEACIPALVVGNTKAELDEALEKSKAEFIRIKGLVNKTPVIPEVPVVDPRTLPQNTAQNTTTSQTTTPAKTEVTETTTTPVTTTTIPAPSTIPATDANAEIPDMKNMSQKEFEERKEELRKKIKGL